MRATNIVLNVMSLLLVAAGLGLISTFFFPSVPLQPAGPQDAAIAPPEDFNVPVLTEETTSAPRAGETNTSKNTGAAENEEARGEQQKNQDKKQKAQKETKPAVPVPEDKTLWVTVPKMDRVQSAAIPDTVGDDEESLKNFAGIHLRGTGFPWQEEANVYIAGHRLGYPNTNSFLAFWDLNAVGEGDEVYVTDAMGRSYTYRVFKELVVNPSDTFITQPVKGKNIITLQTCTLPDYSQRLIVQAEKVT
ncbi:MAG: class E sortase [Actinomycetota bacterium]|nr:class E sortase [Actinomycetota bacterium]HZY66034.1 class E sortase [Rubrobacteraceae bacterium]